MFYKTVIFERLSTLYYPILKYFLWKKREIRFFEVANSADEAGWVKRLVKEDKILPLPSLRDSYHECHGLALDNIEKSYASSVAKSSLVREMIKVYGSENIALAYKKELARNLAEFYYVNLYLNDEEKRLGEDENILFVPHNYRRYWKLVRASGVFYRRCTKVKIAGALGALNNINDIKDKVRDWLLQCMNATLYLGKLALSRSEARRKEYRYAILLKDADYQFKSRSRPVDFLLDGKNINRDNAVFLALTPAISQENWEEMIRKKLQVVDCSNLFRLRHGLDNKEKTLTLKKLLSYLIRNILSGLSEDYTILKVNSILLPVFLQWRFILSQISIKHVITFNDESIHHIGRSVLLDKIGTKTWYYAHAANLGHLNLPITRHLLRAFLYYDNYVSWNDEVIDYYKLHPGMIRNYLSVGCLWSEPVVDILEGRVKPDLKQTAFANIRMDEYKVLAFFDTTYRPGSVSPLEGGVAFYGFLLRLLDEMTDVLAIVKEKKAAESVLAIYERFGGNSRVFYEQYQPALDRLRDHPRCRVTGYNGDSADIIALSNLPVSLKNMTQDTFDNSSSGEQKWIDH